MISCGARLAPFDIPQLREIMSYDELELDRMGDRKTATFFCISDTDSTYNFLVALAFSQMFNLLCERADNVHGGRLPHHVRVLWDEAANTGQVPGLEKLVAVIRSREVSLVLLYDKNTNKQFISVQTSGGNTFYIVIDYDKPTDEDGEQYETYFFSIVDEADLLAAMESAGVELPACTCKEKCVVGAINTDCPVCSINMGECAGMTPEPEPEPTTEPQPEEPAKKNGAGPLILVLAIFAIGGGAGWYFKIYRPQHQQAATPEDNYEEEMDAYNDFEDDGPPWDEDDPEPGEEDEA